MTADRLLAHYEQIADARDAIPRLRRFILNLAVRGKLVEQDPNDEPSSELLKQIATEKSRLVKAKKVSKQAPFQPPDLSEMSFDLPSSWDWCPSTYPSYIVSDKGKKIQTKDVVETGKFPVVDQGKVLIRGYHNDANKVIRVKEPIVLFGDHTRETKLIDFDFVVGADGVKLLHPVSLHTAYYFLALQWLPLESRGYGRHFKLLKASFIPLPPLAEQHRIVAKVDELMALCDRLEAARVEREATRDRLSAASLARLNTPDPDRKVFQGHAAFALENLAPLTTRLDQIKTLRQTILNLAVRGKLVEQDPNDEPASELLKRIAAEKMRLVREKKRTRVRRASTPAICSYVPFDLPAGWSPVKIEQILVEIQTGPFGSSLHQSDYQLGGTPVINPASIQNERIVPVDKMAVGPVTLERLASFKLRTGDVIMGRRGEMGRCAVVSERESGWLCGTGSLILRALEYIYPRFLSMLIGSPFSRQYLGETAVGTTMQNLNQTILLNLSFGIPPLTEQHRIVAKVDELMVLCDRLEASLADSDTTRQRLLETLLHEALTPAAAREMEMAE